MKKFKNLGKIKMIENEISKPTKEMKNWFDKRTNTHIKYVQEFMGKIIKNNKFDFLDKNILNKESKYHDDSKFREPEYTPYCFTTWEYKCKDDNVSFKVPKDIKDKMNKATTHHVMCNKHHPEYWQTETTNLININDRDKPPKEIINAEKMPLEYVAVMCADWMAMSKEKNTCPYEWAKNNIDVRWKFSNIQKNLIYMLIDEIWRNKKSTFS